MAVQKSTSNASQTKVRNKKTETAPTTDPETAGLNAQTQSEHFAILQMGVSIWNQWRATEPLIRPNLSNANLTGFHLENINFCRTDLRGANLSNAYLYDADFQGADLRRAILTRAGLIGANLHRVKATDAILEHAYLAQSDLSQANFTEASLQKADLQAALVRVRQRMRAAP